MSSQEDLYRVLDVPRSATADEIKSAYRKQVLLHHPDRAAANKDRNAEGSPRFGDDEDAQIQKINHAYGVLGDPKARVKYDLDTFGSSSGPGLDNQAPGDYRAMTADDVDQMFSGLNTFERFTTAQYHAHRSKVAPAAIGRRATGFHERKQFRASQLPSKGTSVAWLCFPVLILGLWGYNLTTLKKDANRKHQLR